MSVTSKLAAPRRNVWLAPGRLSGLITGIRRWIARHPDATAYLAIVGLVVIWHRGLIFDPGYLGLRDDWPVPPVDWQNAQIATDHMSSWRPNLFGAAETERTMSIYRLYIWGLLAELVGVDGWLHSRFPIAMIGLAGVLAYQAAKAFSLVRPAAFAAAVVYMTTPLFLDVFVTGYMPMFIGIALLPKAVQVAHEAFERPLGVRGFARGFVWIGLSASTIHLSVMMLAVVGAYTIFRAFSAPGSRRQRVRRVGCVAAMATSVALLHPPIAFIAWQLLTIPAAAEVLGAWTREAGVQWIKDVAPTLAESLTLTGLPYNYSTATSIPGGSAPVFPVIARGLLAGIGLVAPILMRGRARQLAVVLLLGFLAFTLLGKGSNEPLSIVQEVVDATLLGTVFRNVRYWNIPAGLLLALLIGHVVAYLVARPPGMQRTAASASVAGVIALSALPFWSGDLAGHLPPYAIDADTVTVMANVTDLPHTDRMVHVPMLGPSRYASRTGRTSAPGNNPFVLQSPKPTLWVSPQPPLNAPYVAALYHGLYSPSRYPVDRLLAHGRVQHVVLDPHWESVYAAFILPTGEPWLRSQESHPRPQIALAAQPGLRRLDELSAGEVDLYQVMTDPSQRLSVPARVIVGSPSLRPLVTAWHAFDDAGSVTLTSGQAGVAGIEGAPGVAVQHGSEIWLGADPTDLVASFLPPGLMVAPADQVFPRHPDASLDWVATYKNAWWYVDPEVADLTRSIVTKAGGAAFSITVDTQRATRELWVRHFVGPEGSSLTVMLDGRDAGRIQTRDEASYGYRWTRIAVPTDRSGAHTIRVHADGPGLNAVSQIGLLSTEEIEAAEFQAEQALARLPVYTVLPDLGVTDGDRVFHLPLPGAYTVQLAAKPGQNPTVKIDGVQVQLQRIGAKLDSDILAGTVQLEAGTHHLELRTGPRPDPVTVSVTHRPLGSTEFQPCEVRVCEGEVRIEASVPADGRTVSFTGRVVTGVEDSVELTGAQAYPPMTHAIQQVPAEQRVKIVQIDIPLDPGSDTASLEVQHLRPGRPGLAFELLDVGVSRLPHGVSVVLARESQRPAPADAALTPTSDTSTLAAAVYHGEPGERLVRLDVRFDPRWTLKINDRVVDEQRHVILDGHFNGWAVRLAPGDVLTATFTPQTAYFWIQIVNLGLLAGMVLVGWVPVPRLWRRRR